jgi:PAS domain S-box-containing protein
MKKNSRKIILIYFIVTFLLVFTSQLIIFLFFDHYSLVAVFLVALITSLILTYFQKYLIKKNTTNSVKILKELRLINEDLSKSNERYDIVSKATSDTIWDWDLSSGGFIWNKGIYGVFGYKKDQVGDNFQWWFDKIHPEDSLKMSVKVYNNIEQKTEKWQDYYRFQCANGTYKYVYDRGFLVMDENKNPIRIIGAMQDITKLKEEEQRLKLLETVITQSKDSVIITEVNSASKGIPKIIYVNPAFTQITGYGANEVIGKTPAVFMNKNSVKNDFKRISESLKKKIEFRFDVLNLNKKKEEYWVNFTTIPITNKDNEHSHWISIQRDITQEKKREKEREQLINELTINNKDLKQFSYIISHNLKAPLSNLTGLLNLIEDTDIHDPELLELINGFSKSTHLLNETINDLVKIIVIKDSTSIEREEVSILEVFENVFNQLNFLINSNSPILKIALDKCPTLFINKSYLESILLNLTTNSLKYRELRRPLKISISSYSDKEHSYLVFKDNGMGIDLNRHGEKIFGLYQRFHSHTDSKGLGLYLVKSQVEAMGGTISVESKVNEGTTFTLQFNKEQQNA